MKKKKARTIIESLKEAHDIVSPWPEWMRKRIYVGVKIIEEKPKRRRKKR